MKRRSLLLIALAALVIIAGVAMVAYRAGTGKARAELAALQEEMDRLLASEKDAAIVKRVSQQMEDIAYQQKAISDQQRDRAEEHAPVFVPGEFHGQRSLQGYHPWGHKKLDMAE